MEIKNNDSIKKIKPFIFVICSLMFVVLLVYVVQAATTTIGNGITTDGPLQFSAGAGDGLVLTSDNLGNATWQSLINIWDTDADTGIQTEETADDDFLRFDVAGTESMVIDNAGNVGIGTAAIDNSAILQLDSTTQGFLPPRMTGAQISAITTPVAGLLVYNTDDQKYYSYNSILSKWLSEDSITQRWNENGNCNNEYMKIGNMVSNLSGWLAPHDGTIVHISAISSGGNLSKGIEIHKNGTSVYPFALSSSQYNQAPTPSDIEFSVDDYLNIFCVQPGSAAQNVVVTLTIKWRL